MKLLKRIIIVYFTKIGKYIHPPPDQIKPEVELQFVSQQIFNEQMQTIEMTCITRGSQEPVIAHLVFNLTSKVDRKWGCYT